MAFLAVWFTSFRRAAERLGSAGRELTRKQNQPAICGSVATHGVSTPSFHLNADVLHGVQHRRAKQLTNINQSQDVVLVRRCGLESRFVRHHIGLIEVFVTSKRKAYPLSIV